MGILSPSKLHVNGGIKSVKVSERDHLKDESKKFQLTINMTDKNKVFIYTDQFGLKKLTMVLSQFWTEMLNDPD